MSVVEGKLVVLGSQGVGKTSLVVRYIGKMFSSHISPTIGASFFTCSINMDNTKVKLQVWDTAGQERFRAMAPMYYRNANAALLVYDISNVQSFLAIKSWVRELQSNVPDPMILCMVGNKVDLPSKERMVDLENAQNYAASIGAKHYEASAVLDKGIEEVFEYTAKALLEKSKAGLLNNQPYSVQSGKNAKGKVSSRWRLNELDDVDVENNKLCC